jgi:hypothetical protein
MQYKIHLLETTPVRLTPYRLAHLQSTCKTSQCTCEDVRTVVPSYCWRLSAVCCKADPLCTARCGAADWTVQWCDIACGYGKETGGWFGGCGCDVIRFEPLSQMKRTIMTGAVVVGRILTTIGGSVGLAGSNRVELPLANIWLCERSMGWVISVNWRLVSG